MATTTISGIRTIGIPVRDPDANQLYVGEAPTEG
jgi:hypothetical protein